MPEHLKSLIVILGLATGVYMFARASATAVAMTPADFERRRNVWYGLTLIAFLSHNFWLYMFAAGILLYSAVGKERNKLALYFAVLFTLPGMSREISGFGIVNFLFEIDFLRLLALTFLLPTYLVLRKQPGTQRFGSTLADKLLLAYLVIAFLLMLRYAPFTVTLRRGFFYAFIDTFLPYYVASRALRSTDDVREALMAFVVGVLVLSAILSFESLRSWLVYSALEHSLQARWGWSQYMQRSGSLRASGTIGHAIAAGYVVTVAMAFFLYLRKVVPGRLAWSMGFLLLFAGLLAPVSRGPWVGAALALVVFLATGPAPVTALAKLAGAGLLCLPILATPLGASIIDHLPFIGTVEATNVEFRARLAEASLQVFMQSPLFGSYDFLETPAMQALRGADGLIDLVNTYIVIALSNGLVGLALFVGFFLAILAKLWRGMRSLADRTDERYVMGQSLLAALVAILLIISTMSPVLVVPTVYWCIAGVAAAYARLLATSGAPSSAPAEAAPARARPRRGPLAALR
jgi:hypothetical protein